jgi:hypothetical protein
MSQSPPLPSPQPTQPTHPTRRLHADVIFWMIAIPLFVLFLAPLGCICCYTITRGTVMTLKLIQVYQIMFSIAGGISMVYFSIVKRDPEWVVMSAFFTIPWTLVAALTALIIHVIEPS